MKGFIRLGSNQNINDTVVKNLIVYKTIDKIRYFLKDIYNITYSIDEKHFLEAKRKLGDDMVIYEERR